MVSRKGMIIFFQTPKVVAEIEKAGVHVVYKNDKRNYLTGYVDSAQFEKVKKQVEAIKNVRKVEESLQDMQELDFKE